MIFLITTSVYVFSFSPHPTFIPGELGKSGGHGTMCHGYDRFLLHIHVFIYVTPKNKS